MAQKLQTGLIVSARNTVLNISTWRSKPYLLITTMPKTGSTFLLNLLSTVFDYRMLSLLDYLDNDHNLAWLTTVYASRFKTITRIHARATRANLLLINNYSMDTVVLVRNIFDVVVSLRDHLHRESLSTPMTYFDSNCLQLTESQLIDAIIDLFVPWNLGFYASWYEAERADPNLKLLWITYEQMIGNKVDVINRVANHCEIDTSSKKVAEAISAQEAQKQSMRYNQGIKGRGETLLTDVQKERIRAMVAYYPSTDFSLIGL